MRFGRGRPPYEILSLLLQYPDDGIVALRDEIRGAVEDLPASSARTRLRRFMRYWLTAEPIRLRQDYVATFDLQRRSGLYLSYYVDGDTRKRGVALLRLNGMYRATGLVKEQGELPDYLPLVLEFAAHAPVGAGRQVLVEYRTSLELIRRRLHESDSPYADLLEVVCRDLPALNVLQRADLARLAAEGPPMEQVGLLPFAPPEVMPAMEPRR